MPALGYQGQYTDPATGDVDMSARWYSPSTGSFTSSDALTGSPMAYAVNPSPYGYGADNPLTNVDPTGHNWDPLDTLGRVADDVRNWSEDALRLGEEGAGYADAGLETGFEWAAAAETGILLAGGYLIYKILAPAPTAEGCWVDVVCGVSGGSGSPIPSYPRAYSGPGAGSCGMACYVLLPPPPPPPPLQDVYAGPNPAAPPRAPRWMHTAPYINTSAGRVPRHDAGQIIERTQPVREKPTGLTDILTGQPGVVTDVTGLTQSNLDQVAIPAPPAPRALTASPTSPTPNPGPSGPEPTVGGAGGSGVVPRHQRDPASWTRRNLARRQAMARVQEAKGLPGSSSAPTARSPSSRPEKANPLAIS